MEEEIMEGRGRSLGNVGNLFPAIFIPRNGDDRLVLTSRFGPILIGNKEMETLVLFPSWRDRSKVS